MNGSKTHRTGVVICALLALTDIAGLAGIGQDGAPPTAVILIGAVLGVVTLVAALPALNDRTSAVLTMAGSRIGSAALGIPVFFVDDAPVWAPAAVTVTIALTALGTWLLLADLRTRRPVHA